MDSRTRPNSITSYDAPKIRWFPVLMYHRVAPQFEMSVSNNLCVSAANFEAQMRFLKARGYQATSLETVADNIRRGTQPKPKQVVITFDDGYHDVFLHAFPILMKYQFTATVFLVSDYLGSSNVWDRGIAQEVQLLDLEELQEMKRYGISFGSHGVTHRRLTELDRQASWEELVASKLALEDTLEVEIRSFSFPYGTTSPAIQKMAMQAGYVSACGIEQREHTLYNLSRIDVPRCGSSGLGWRYRLSGMHFRLRRNPAVRSLKRFFR